MPFNWQQGGGALMGNVPNQMNSFTPQNNEGLGMPWNQAMFNLPRFQMPGSQINFGGGFGFGGREGPNQMGMASGVQPVGVNFSINRQASSDPVKNIINDIQNPLGGMTANFSGMGGGGGGRLKSQMTGLQSSAMPEPIKSPGWDYYNQSMANGGNAVPIQAPGWDYYNQAVSQGLAGPPFGLRTRMTQMVPNAIFY